MTTLDTTTTKPTGECHPACRLLPALSDEQFAELVADISNYGQRHPIIVDQAGVILDGRHRFRALQELSMEPKVQTFRGKEAEKVALVISENIRRRHLTDQQRAHVAAELADMARGGDRGNQQRMADRQLAGWV
jgi:ParB-like chromosome segregation protein Spo0J